MGIRAITVEIREDRGRAFLAIDAPDTHTILHPLGGSIGRVKAQSKRLMKHFSELASEAVVDKTLEARAKRTLNVVDDVFHQLFELNAVSAQDRLSKGKITAGDTLRTQILRLTQAGAPIYFRSLDNYGPLPWELFIVADGEKTVRLSELAWLARIDRARVSNEPFFSRPETPVHNLRNPVHIRFFKGHGLPAADDELERLSALGAPYSLTSIDDREGSKSRKDIVAAITGSVEDCCEFLHFACHCSIRDSGGTSYAFDIAGNSGLPDNEISRAVHAAGVAGELPIVFLNVCYGAVDKDHTMNPTEQFLGLGARAVISAADLVNDDAAPIFAEAFYSVIADRLNRRGKVREIHLSEALYETRNTLRSWAANDTRKDKGRAQTALQRLTPETFMVTAEGGDLVLRASWEQGRGE